VLYLLEDKEYPASDELIELTKMELMYSNQYKNKTGLYWRSYFGENGPRPPSNLFMWPADEIGQVHQVISNHGFW
jgi:hypothetical protein